jgi:hypothetical protein
LLPYEIKQPETGVIAQRLKEPLHVELSSLGHA